MIFNILIGLILIILLLISAFFSSSETAFLSLSKIKVRQMLKDKKPKAKIIAQLKENTDKLITTILIGNNFINSLASSLATALAVSIFANNGTIIATVVMTVLLIIFGEVLPKTIAAYHPSKIATRNSRSLLIIEKILSPAVKFFALITKSITFVESKICKNKTPIITELELKKLIDVGNQEGTLESNEKTMLNKIFEFNDLKTKDILRHRSLIASINIDATYEETVEMFALSGYSRLAVYKDDTSAFCGIIHYKDVLFYSNKKSNFSLKQIMHEPLFVPESKTAFSLLQLFKIEKRNIAITIDEHGSVSGIVTMDDILKAVFGRITDEYTDQDVPQEDRIEILNHTQFRVPGNIQLSTINDVFNLQLESEDFETIGGWLLEQFGFLPESGETLKRNDVVYTVEDQAQRKIISIRITFLSGIPAKALHIK